MKNFKDILTEKEFQSEEEIKKDFNKWFGKDFYKIKYMEVSEGALVTVNYVITQKQLKEIMKKYNLVTIASDSRSNLQLTISKK